MPACPSSAGWRPAARGPGWMRSTLSSAAVRPQLSSRELEFP
ncbi:rCG48599, partial [Rattus norvegicus]